MLMRTTPTSRNADAEPFQPEDAAGILCVIVAIAIGLFMITALFNAV